MVVMEYKLSHLVEVARLQTLTDLFYKGTGIPLSVVDRDGSILAESGQRDICSHLHLLSLHTRQRCRRSGTSVAIKVKSGRKYMVEKCTHGLFDTWTPITVLGDHLGNFVAGPFFLQPPDIRRFKRQAKQLGSNESAYMDAVSKVPVVDEPKLHTFLQCSAVLTEILGEAGIRKLTDEIDQGKRTKEDKSELEENILSNMKELILPYLHKLKKSGLSAAQASMIDVLESNLKQITSPIIRKMQTLGLTARESAVASLIKEGKTTKQIAELLGVSPRAVEFHRYNIRKKLELDHKKTNLKACLLSIA